MSIHDKYSDGLRPYFPPYPRRLEDIPLDKYIEEQEYMRRLRAQAKRTAKMLLAENQERYDMFVAAAYDVQKAKDRLQKMLPEWEIIHQIESVSAEEAVCTLTLKLTRESRS